MLVPPRLWLPLAAAAVAIGWLGAQSPAAPAGSGPARSDQASADRVSSPQGSEWPDFRGPSWNGHVPEAAVPLEWAEDENVRWKVEIPGQGWSSPVVADGKVWLTTATDSGKRLHVLAVAAATGHLLLDRVLFENEQPENKNALNSYASPSPTVEPGRVYVHFGSYGTACLDTASFATLWSRRDIRCDHMEGPGSSPVLFRDLLIFNVDGGDVQFVIALDKESGETRWRTERSVDLSGLPADLRKAYSTPVVVDVGGEPWLISSGANATGAYDPFTGEERWRVRYKGFSMASRPLVSADMLFVTTGFARAQMHGVRLQGAGDVTDQHVAWTYGRNVPKMSSPLLVADRLFMVDDGGFATCLDTSDGRAVWRQRIGGEHCASPVCIGDRIYFFDREGRTVVIRRSDEFVQLASNQLDDGFMASPAVTGDAFILRTRSHLYRIERR